MRVAEWVHEGSQRSAAVGQSREALGMEQNLLLRTNGAEQKQYIFDAQLLEQHAHTAAGHGQGGRERRLQRLFVAGADGESHLGPAGRRNLKEILNKEKKKIVKLSSFCWF